MQEVDAFAALVGLLDGTPAAARERRELLAGMYLRRGFLASAAEEWLGVCQDDPRDVRGLVGLAQVAAAQGMTDDAIELAREAAAIEPGDATCDATARAARAAGGVGLRGGRCAHRSSSTVNGR